MDDFTQDLFGNDSFEEIKENEEGNLNAIQDNNTKIEESDLPKDMAMSEKKDKSSSFEADMSRLEEIVNQLESGGKSLEDSLKLFEEGQKLLSNCREKLEKAQVRVSKLMSGGTLEEIDPEALGR